MVDKYIKVDAVTALETEVEATVVTTGVAEAGDIIGLDAGGHIDLSLLPTGVGPDTKVVPASEALAAGDMVNIFPDVAVSKARKADANDTGKTVSGFVVGAVASGANAMVFFEGVLTGLSGLTIGAAYYLSDATAGQIVLAAAAPTTAGTFLQKVGIAISATELSFERSRIVVRG